MSDHEKDRIEGLEPRELFRAALGDTSDDPEAAERAAEEERQVRAEIQKRLPDVEIFELLGRGGMGYVYRGCQKNLDREVAIKVVAPRPERQADFAARFAREARTLARLNHPNIVAVHDYGQDGPFCWLVMEYVDGSNLREVIRGGKLDPGEALALVPKICDALQYAHDHGIVHRDVKPENILLDRKGAVKIADFGLAKLIGTPAALVTLTGDQQVLGTLRYMAPEQLERPLEVDHRADIYSLGVVFYEMLTGEIPMGRFARPSQRSKASPEVDDVVLRALEKEPELRYQRASEVKSDLGSLERGESLPVTASEPKASALAVLASVLFGMGFLPFLFSVTAWLVTRSGSTVEVAAGPSVRQLSMAMIFGMIPGVIGLALMVTGSALGFWALENIRRAWPRLYGAGAAIVGAWAGILLVANASLAAWMLGFWKAPGEIPSLVLVVGMLLFLAIDVALLASRRRRFLESCAGAATTGRQR